MARKSTPSLVISPKTNLWHCLGACNVGGSNIDWVMKTKGVSFRHAVELLRADRLYTETGNAGHFWMAAYNQANGQSAIMDFGPANGASQTRMALGGDVPGNTNYASQLPDVNNQRRRRLRSH